jgi:L-threonylcarbamoyladenylate synthase
MKTAVKEVSKESIAQAATLIKAGQLVAFPTETVYGLGADALNPAAVLQIFAAKNRPADNPLIVHIADLSALPRLVEIIPLQAQKLIDAFWPGPLSIVFKKSALVPAQTTAGLDTVVIRFPSHPGALQLIAAAGTPIAAPSANQSGNVSPTTAQHVQEELDGIIPLILDGGAIEFGLESTVIDCTAALPTLLRPGSITKEQIEKVVGPVGIPDEAEKPASPGMKYKHYSPQTPVILFTTPANLQAALLAHPKRSCIIHYSDALTGYSEIAIPLSDDPTKAAAELYSALRQADTLHCDFIYVETFPKTSVGVAIMNRLEKAASDFIG